MRITVLSQTAFWLLTFAQMTAVAQESAKSQGEEARKLALIVREASQQRFVPALGNQPAYCSRFMASLAGGQNVHAIEPILRTQSVDDPGLKDWRRCDTGSQETSGARDPRKVFVGPASLGGPPFRYYRVDIDGNKANGDEDLLYHEKSRGELRHGSTGYTWVDLQRCVTQGGASLKRSSDAPVLRPADVLARYENEYVVLDLYTNSRTLGAATYRLNLYRLNHAQPMECSWRQSASQPSSNKRD